ncbi:MAG: hypothetical protein AMXMBFR58_03010 [Phycisphaerae bacterium]
MTPDTRTAGPPPSTQGFGHLAVSDPEIIARIRATYATTFFSDRDAEFVKSPAGQADIDFNAFVRYDQSVRFALPWVDRVCPISGKRVLEIGCGTGSSAAAFARLASSLHTCDVDHRGFATARERFRLLGIDNVTIDPVGAPEFFDVAVRYAPSFDLVLLFAVLEHQTLDERIETLHRAWDLLAPDGSLVVIETPNRLCYFDNHTLLEPFYGMLPPDLVLRAGGLSQGTRFQNVMKAILAGPPEERPVALTRWGRGISYHDIDIAIPRDQYTVVADGYEFEMLNFFPMNYDERLLQSYFAQAKLDVSPAFARSVLCFILRKDGGKGQAPVRRLSPLVASAAELKSLHDDLTSLSTAEVRQRLNNLIQFGTLSNNWAV